MLFARLMETQKIDDLKALSTSFCDHQPTGRGQNAAAINVAFRRRLKSMPRGGGS